MKSRRRAREAALQALYQCDTLSDWTPASSDFYFDIFHPISECTEENEKENLEFSKALVTGVINYLEFLDSHISSASTHWSIGRMSRVDRNILRISTFEMAFLSNMIPVNVSMNEAIEIAKRYGTEDSPMFINGVLDNISKIFAQNPALALEAGKRKRVANG